MLEGADVSHREFKLLRVLYAMPISVGTQRYKCCWCFYFMTFTKRQGACVEHVFGQACIGQCHRIVRWHVPDCPASPDYPVGSTELSGIVESEIKL